MSNLRRSPRSRRSRRVSVAIGLGLLAGLVGCYRDRPVESHVPPPPGPEEYRTIGELENGVVRVLAADLRLRLVEEGTTAGVPARVRRLLAFAPRRVDLHDGSQGERFERLTAEQVSRYEALLEASVRKDLREGRRLWGEIEAACHDCHASFSVEIR